MLKSNIRTFNEFVFQNNSRNYSVATASLVVLIASMVLAGWQLNIEFFKRPISGLVAMNPITAIGLLLYSFSIILYARFSEKRIAITIAKSFACLASIIGMVKLLNVIGGMSFEVDRLLYKQKLLKDMVNGLPNGMAPNAALNFIFLGSALLTLKTKKANFVFASNFLAFSAAFVSLLSIIGYTYGAHSFSDIEAFHPMAFHTALCFLVLSIATLCIETSKGIMTIVSGSQPGRHIIGLLLPMAVIVPILFGLLRLYGERMGAYDNTYGTALFAAANVVIFVYLIFKTASTLNRSDKSLMIEIEERKKVEKELKERNIFLNGIFQNAPNMIFVKDAKDFRFLQINKDGERLMGVPRDEIIGKNDYDLFPTEQANYLRTTDRKLFETRTLLDIPEEKLTTANGDRWLHTKKIPVFDEDNNPQYLLGIAEDITELKLQNDKLQQFYKELELKVQQRTQELFKSEQRFKALLENSIDAICLTGRDGTIIYQSPSVERMTGYTLEDRNTKKLNDFIHPSDSSRARKLLSSIMDAPGTSSFILFRFLHKERHYIWVEGSVTNLLHDESVQALVYNFRNITEKKMAEEALALSEEKYRLLFSNNPMPAWVFDTETLAFLEVNNAAVNHYGYTVEEFTQMTIKDIRPPEDVQQLLRHRTHTENSKDVIYSGYWRHKTKDGRIIFVEITSRHIDFKGRTARLVISHDITDKVEAERKLNEANETLQVRARELTASNKDLEQFAYVASHDLQEPLRMVSSFLQLLEKKYKDLLDDTGRQYIHFAVDGAERMKRLILDLLTYSRAGTSREMSSTIDMNEIAQDVVSTFSFTLKETGAQIIVNHLPQIVAVKSQMHQLLQNLVSNAIKYRREEALRIEISCEERDSDWKFTVSDNGLGIDKRFFEKVFVIFQRLHNKTEYSGTGIGLAICKKIVERHGGTIWLESEVGKGTQFFFSIKK